MSTKQTINTQDGPASDAVTVSKKSLQKLLKPLVFIVCLFPLLTLAYGVFSNKFVDPIESLILGTGEWGLRFLLITLCITPIQFIFKWGGVAKLRRMLGLFAFFYASLHMLVWLVLDQGLVFTDVIDAVIEKKFITLGMLVWVGMLFLAATSNRYSVRKLGRKWKKLHNWVYLLAVLAVVHFIWQVKASEILEPSAYLGVLFLLLFWRFFRMVKR